MGGKKIRFRVCLGFFFNKEWSGRKFSLLPLPLAPDRKKQHHVVIQRFQARLQRVGLLQKICKTAEICFFPWPEWLPEAAAPPPGARSPLPGPSAHVSSRGTVSGNLPGAAREGTMLPSFRITWLPKPNPDLARKARLIKKVLSCVTHPEGSYFPLDFFFFFPSLEAGEGAGSEPSWYKDVSPRH